MKSQLFSLFLIIFPCVTIYAQDFTGYVKKADSISSPIFQAKVEITEGNKLFKTFRTYFDGSFKFTPNKSQTYLIKISYSGYADTTYTITTDKNAKTDVQSVTVRIKKDGMRLMGVVKSREEDFPIKGATIVLRNVMTRKEERITTDIDGKYNFKLEYETNYKVWIDKRSTGIFNQYRDTSFYISTIGFNQPLDYKLDIFLDWMENATTTVREGYDASKQPANKNIKPVISITSKETPVKKDSIPPIVNSMTTETDRQPFKEQERKSEVMQDMKNGTFKKAREKKKKKKTDVVVFKDTNQITTAVLSVDSDAVNLLEMTRQKAIADKKAREEEKTRTEMVPAQKAEKVSPERKTTEVQTTRPTTDIEEKRKSEEIGKAQKQQQELIKAAEIFAKRMKLIQDSIDREKTQEAKKVEEFKRQKAKEDSVSRIKQRNDSILVAAVQKQKAKDDSLTRAKVQIAKIAKETAAREKAKQDSIAKIKSLQERIIPKLRQHIDSSSRSTELPPTKTVGDSTAQKKKFYMPKSQEELIATVEAFAKRKKFVQDSVAKAKGTDPPKSRDLQQNKK